MAKKELRSLKQLNEKQKNEYKNRIEEQTEKIYSKLPKFWRDLLEGKIPTKQSIPWKKVKDKKGLVMRLDREGSYVEIDFSKKQMRINLVE